jgi:hypothetical protein
MNYFTVDAYRAIMKKYVITLLIVMAAVSARTTQFEELDKPPEGAHKGQMLLAAFGTIGVPYGRIIHAESDFVRNSTYTFLNSFITKKIMLQHLSFSYGLMFEYMPIDYLGIRFKAKRSTIVQRSMFGSEYQNWTKTVYSDYSFYLGPTVHATTRKQWDISLTPVAGYDLGQYSAAPIAMNLLASQLIYNRSLPTAEEITFFYNASTKKKTYNFVVGAELDFSIYFSGGFYLSLGCDWVMNMLKFNKKFYINNPQTLIWFFSNKKSSDVHTVSFIISAGYAFSN